MKLLFDTNVVSEWAKPEPDSSFVRWIGSVDSETAYVSVVTLAEIQRGIEQLPAGRRRERLSAWLREELIAVFADRIVGVDQAIAAAWGRVMARCDSAGRPMGTLDAFLAATAVELGMTLVTRNVSDFSAAGIAVVNPWSGSA